jgi:hypothetical protein
MRGFLSIQLYFYDGALLAAAIIRQKMLVQGISQSSFRFIGGILFDIRNYLCLSHFDCKHAGSLALNAHGCLFPGRCLTPSSLGRAHLLLLGLVDGLPFFLRIMLPVAIADRT